MDGSAAGDGARGALESALAKAKWRVLPLLSLCYLVAYMDRTNISFAAESMNRDLHFSPTIYGFGAGLFFLTYAACEIPSNALMLRFGARRWLARIMLTWGLLAGAMMLVRVPAHFYGVRLLLGCAEAGYFPGALYYLSQWFPKSMRARAISWFYMSLPFSSVVMGSVAGSLLRLNGRLGLRGWQWIFLVESAPAVVLAVVIWVGLSDSVWTAKWLSSEEKLALGGEIEAERAAQVAEAGEAGEGQGGLGEVLRSGRAWALGGAYFSQLAVSYALVFSLPLVLKQLTGLDPGRVGYLIAVSGMAGAVGMVAIAWWSDKIGKRLPFVLAGFGLMAVGSVVVGVHLAGWIAVGALFVIQQAFFAMQAPMLSAMTTIFAGKTAAIAIAFANTCSIIGGFVAPIWMGWMLERTHGYALGLGMLVVPSVAGGLLMIVVLRPVRGAVAVAEA